MMNKGGVSTRVRSGEEPKTEVEPWIEPFLEWILGRNKPPSVQVFTPHKLHHDTFSSKAKNSLPDANIL